MLCPRDCGAKPRLDDVDHGLVSWTLVSLAYAVKRKLSSAARSGGTGEASGLGMFRRKAK